MNVIENPPDFKTKDEAIEYYKECALSTRHDFDEYEELSKQMEEDQNKEIDSLETENKNLKKEANTLKNVLEKLR